jgi:hypothetical protein
MFSIPLQFDKSTHDFSERDSERRIGVNKVRFSSITTEYYVTTSTKKERDEPCWEMFLNAVFGFCSGLCCFTDTSESVGKIRNRVSRQESTEEKEGSLDSFDDGG